MAPSSKVNKVLMADMGYPIDPHSLYKAIAWSSQLGLPMYVMENGAPFDKDDTRRTEWINCALEQVLYSSLLVCTLWPLVVLSAYMHAVATGP